MRIVIALGGNALLRRGEPMTAEVQRTNLRAAAPALAAVARSHQLVVSHGNGPQVGLLALQAADPSDPAFEEPTKFVGPVYEEADADRLASEKGWTFKRDGDRWRRVVPSPEPKRIFEIRPVRWLLDNDAVVICAGGGCVPSMHDPNSDRTLMGVEAVVDKDLASELLAREVAADLFVMVTDVDGVYADWGTPDQRRLERVTPSELRAFEFAAGSMGPKGEAAIRFVDRTGMRAAIGGLGQIEETVQGGGGTQVVPA